MALACLAATAETNAAQVLSGRPDDTLSAAVSRGSPTLIRVEGHRVRRVYGAKGEFNVTADAESGVAYIQPTTDRPAINVFVADDTGRTWKLLLSVTDAPTDNSIVIKGKGASAEQRAGRDFARNRTIKRIVLALDNDEDTEFETRKVNDVVPLWREAMFVLVKVVNGPLKGEAYMLTNTSDKPMVIDERQLYRKGVVAVVVEKPELKPAETTPVYIVSEAE